jgi:hypothetical protein
MRLTTDWRRALVLIAIASLAGCGTRSSGTFAGPASGSTTTGIAATGQTPRQVAEAFLKNLTEGKATPDNLTDGFKKQIAKPFLDVDAAEWLATFKGTTFVIGEVATLGPDIVVRGRAESSTAKRSFVLRLSQKGDAFLADWLHLSSHMGPPTPSPPNPDLAAAQDVLRNFLDLLMGGDQRMVHALMAPEWRKQKSPPSGPDLQKGYDHGPGFLTQQTRAWGSGLVGYTFGKPELSPTKDRATFPVELEADGKKTQETLTAAKDPNTGRWHVVAFTK